MSSDPLKYRLVEGICAIKPSTRLNIYCAPTVKKPEIIFLSLLLSAEDGEAPRQFRFWLCWSYSKKAIPPAWVANIELVPTSKTPQPQAQAERGTGAMR